MAEKVGHFHARNCHWPLESQKQAGPGALMRLHGQQVLAVQFDLATGDFVAGMTHDSES